MELYPVRSVFGYSELGWYLSRWARKSRSRNWVSVDASVEGYELLAARDNGWLVVFFSYDYGGHQFSGEFRKWFLFNSSSMEGKVGEIISEFPRGTTVRVRVNPRHPSESIAET